MLGADPIYIELAGEAFELRPSLRASMRLVRRHGLARLFAAVPVFNVTVIMDLLREVAIKPSLLLEEIAAIGLGRVRNRLTNPLAKFVLSIAGIDPHAETLPAPGKPVDPEQALAQLYRFATGWLGWTPEAAWNATPTEIIEARNGRMNLITEILEAVFGTPASTSEKDGAQYTPDQLKEIEELGHDPAFDRAGLHALQGKGRVN